MAFYCVGRVKGCWRREMVGIVFHKAILATSKHHALWEKQYLAYMGCIRVNQFSKEWNLSLCHWRFGVSDLLFISIFFYVFILLFIQFGKQYLASTIAYLYLLFHGPRYPCIRIGSCKQAMEWRRRCDGSCYLDWMWWTELMFTLPTLTLKKVKNW